MRPGAVAAYLAQVDALLAARKAAPGGELPDKEESRWVEVFDPLWKVLTREEQAAVEQGVVERMASRT